MPNAIENQDIEFQPPVQGYSNFGYAILGFLFLFFIFLAILNYFNIFSLSALYPNQLGFLPHKSFNIQKNNTNNQLPADNPKFKNYSKLENQATDTQISNYIVLINAKKIPTDNSKYPNEIYGIFSGYDSNYIQIVTYNGIKNFAYTKDLTIQQYGQAEKSATSSATTVKLTQIDKSSFLNQSMFGKILHMAVTLTSPITIQQIYLSK